MVNKGMKGMDGITSKSAEERVEMGRRGGSVKSAAKTMAAKVRGIKMMKDGDKKDARILELIQDPTISAYQLTELANTLIEDVPDMKYSDRINLLKTLNDKHKTIFGSKSIITATVTNFDRMKEGWEKMIEDHGEHLVVEDGVDNG